MYKPTIGLEIHIELKTATKMFCGCPNNFALAKPNENTCPVCLGHPGTLPTINHEAVRSLVRFGLAIQGKIAPRTNFDRKSYFYPDLPKGYQISQYELPIVSGGTLAGVRIRRVHLEEDAGRLLHDAPGKTLVDYNRAGMPLAELVTEPDLKTGDEAMCFAKELQLLVRYLGISDADMEKGHMRIEANVSLSKSETLGTKVEVKNINSFKAVGVAIAYELQRQEEALLAGKKVAQETRGWDDVEMKTVSQRSKESAHDYRYFPEPDLPPLEFTPEELEDLKRHLPELPEEKLVRFKKSFGLREELVEDLISDKSLADYFEAASSELVARTKKADYTLLANYLLSDLRGILNTKHVSLQEGRVPPEHLAHLVALIQIGTLSSRLAKDLLAKMFDSSEDPETLMKKEGTKMINSETELSPIIEEVISKNPKAVSDYKNGKEEALQFLFGQAMGMTKGQADPTALRAVLRQILASL